MATISSYRNALVELANRHNQTGWVCDLICKAMQNDGKFSDEDIQQIADSLQNGSSASLTPPANANEEIVPAIMLKSLKHVRGVNALVPNQEIKFCPNHFTLIYGLNASGKSSYFKLLNNISSGIHIYDKQKLYSIQMDYLYHRYYSTVVPLALLLDKICCF